MARKMVCEWGMSEELGPLTYGKKEEHIFLGKEITQSRDFSEHTADKIDEEVKSIVMGSYNRAKELLSTNLDLLKRLAEELLEKEGLDGPEIDRIISGGAPPEPTPPKPDPEEKPAEESSAVKPEAAKSKTPKPGGAKGKLGFATE